MQQQLLSGFAQCSAIGSNQQFSDNQKDNLAGFKTYIKMFSVGGRQDGCVTLHWSTCCKSCIHASKAEVSVCLAVSAPANHGQNRRNKVSEEERSSVFNVCLNVFRFSLEAARRLRTRMEAINIICSPDMQGQPLVYRLHSLSDRVCECADDAGVLDTVQGSGPPGLPGFLPFHPSHSPQRAASTHPCRCPPNFNAEKKRDTK